jgi:hypothetical protein
MTDLELSSLIVIILALCEALKRFGLSTRYIPLIAIALGISGAFYFGGASWLTTVAGVLTALISSGLYSSFKRTVLNK